MTHKHIAHLRHVAQVQAASGNADSAVETLRQALSIDPDDAEAHAQLSALLTDLRRPVAARVEAELALRLDPESLLGHVAMAFAALANRQLDVAQAEVRLLLERGPEEAGFHQVAAHVYAMSGRQADALAALEKAHALAPEDADIESELASAYLSAGEIARAEEHARRALAAAPASVSTNVTMGEVLLRKGAVEAAREHALFALAQNAGDHSALYLMAAIKTRRNPFMGLWWRFNAWMQKFGSAAAAGILVLLYAAYRIAEIALHQQGYRGAAASLNLAWLALVVWTWVAPGLFRSQVQKEIGRVKLRSDF